MREDWIIKYKVPAEYIDTQYGAVVKTTVYASSREEAIEKVMNDIYVVKAVRAEED